MEGRGTPVAILLPRGTGLVSGRAADSQGGGGLPGRGPPFPASGLLAASGSFALRTPFPRPGEGARERRGSPGCVWERAGRRHVVGRGRSPPVQRWLVIRGNRSGHLLPYPGWGEEVLSLNIGKHYAVVLGFLFLYYG